MDKNLTPPIENPIVIEKPSTQVEKSPLNPEITADFAVEAEKLKQENERKELEKTKIGQIKAKIIALMQKEKEYRNEVDNPAYKALNNEKLERLKYNAFIKPEDRANLTSDTLENKLKSGVVDMHREWGNAQREQFLKQNPDIEPQPEDLKRAA